MARNLLPVLRWKIERSFELVCLEIKIFLNYYFFALEGASVYARHRRPLS
jgi:hypothetical protein